MCSSDLFCCNFFSRFLLLHPHNPYFHSHLFSTHNFLLSTFSRTPLFYLFQALGYNIFKPHMSSSSASGARMGGVSVCPCTNNYLCVCVYLCGCVWLKFVVEFFPFHFGFFSFFTYTHFMRKTITLFCFILVYLIQFNFMWFYVLSFFYIITFFVLLFQFFLIIYHHFISFILFFDSYFTLCIIFFRWRWRVRKL